jgi:hypothetical protein
MLKYKAVWRENDRYSPLLFEWTGDLKECFGESSVSVAQRAIKLMKTNTFGSVFMYDEIIKEYGWIGFIHNFLPKDFVFEKKKHHVYLFDLFER